ncbi:MAG: cyanophycin synthetase [Xanthomonadales bacterium]|nr:cyanophycin synthetase [Xanthomonadales bacterium]
MIDLLFKLVYRAQFYLNVPAILQLLRFREIRDTYYQQLWQEAARNIGAQAQDWDFGYMQISRNSLTTVVKQGSVMLDSHLTLDIMGNKALTYALMAEKEYSTPDYQTFTMRSLKVAEAMLNRQKGKEVVVKPVSGTGGGRGVTTGIKDRRALHKAARMAAQFDSHLLVEEQVEGDSFRLLFLDGKFIDAVRRDPPRITGDGKHSIRKLVALENQRRLKERPFTALSALKIDRDCLNWLELQGMTPRSILADGRSIQLKRAVNENRAEQNHNVTEQVHPETVELGRRLAADLGVEFAGLDVLCKDISAPLTRANGWMNEVNTTPGVHHHYLIANPAAGTPVAEKVLEYIFSTGRGAMMLGPIRSNDERAA